MQTLFCQAGKHEWQRASKRGRKPENCPEHARQQITGKPRMTEAQRLKAMQAGRRKAQLERSKDAVARVRAFQAWLTKDAPLWSDFRRGKISRDEYLQRKPTVPKIPSDQDFEMARSVA